MLLIEIFCNWYIQSLVMPYSQPLLWKVDEGVSSIQELSCFSVIGENKCPV
jgi:hypothetical protein